MKYNIRSGVFETNSSSVHTLCIDNEHISAFPLMLEFELGSYGWSGKPLRTPFDRASYLYTGAVELGVGGRIIDRIRTICEKHGVQLKETCKRNRTLCSGLNRPKPLKPILKRMFEDDSLLENFIFGDDSVVFIDNDVRYDDELVYDEEWKAKHPDGTVLYKRN